MRTTLKWISVKDKLPKDGKSVLVHCKYKEGYEILYLFTITGYYPLDEYGRRLPQKTENHKRWYPGGVPLENTDYWAHLPKSLKGDKR